MKELPRARNCPLIWKSNLQILVKEVLTMKCNPREFSCDKTMKKSKLIKRPIIKVSKGIINFYIIFIFGKRLYYGSSPSAKKNNFDYSEMMTLFLLLQIPQNKYGGTGCTSLIRCNVVRHILSL